MMHMKAQFMSIAVLVIFILMLAEVILLISMQIGYDRLQQTNSFTSTSNNYASLITRDANDFGKASLGAALNTLFKYEYNSTMRKGNFVSGFDTYMASLITNGTLPNVVAGSATANTIKSYMGNATFMSYNSNLAASLGVSVGSMSITETTPVITQFSPYTLSVTYIETVRINNSGTHLSYTIPVNATIPLNNTPDLFYAQQGILRYIRFSNMSNLSSVIGNAYATNGSYSFAYGTLYKLSAGASSCPSTASNSIILFTVNAKSLNKCENNFGGLITYGGANMITETPTVPYLIYDPSSNALDSFHNGQSVLLYGPSLATYNIDNLRSNISNGYYFASPYAPSYADRASGVFTNQSSNGMFNFMGYNRQAGSFNGISSNVLIGKSSLFNISSGSFVAWFRTVKSNPQEFVGMGDGTSGGTNVLEFKTLSGNVYYDCATSGSWVINGHTAGASYNDGSWHMAVFTIGSGGNRMYVDGSQVPLTYTAGNSISSNCFVSSVYSSITDIRLGQENVVSYPDYLNGSLANVQIYNSTLNATQVQKLYQQGIESLPASNAGIIGWWPLNGNANDYSGQGNNGIPTNMTYAGITNYNRDSALVRTVPSSLAPIPGVGQCTSTKACLGYNVSRLYLGSNPLLAGTSQSSVAGFNGQSAYIQMPDLGGASNGITLTGWAYGKSVNGTEGIVAYQSRDSTPWIGAYIKFQGGYATYYLGFSDGTSSGNVQPKAVKPGQFYMITLTYNGSAARFYVNGTLERYIAYGKSISSINTSSFIGKDRPGGTELFNGSIADVQVYKTALNSSNVQKLYQEGISGIPIPDAEVVAWYPLNGDANDYSGNGNNGTAYQVAWQQASTLTNSSGYPIPVPSGGISSGSASEWQSLGLGSGYYLPNIYCIGGVNATATTNATYYATALSNAGLGSWFNAQKYPVSLDNMQCPSYDGYIYCVGGEPNGGGSVSDVYYAPISSTGIGTWNAGTSYPLAEFGESCVTSAGYIYCGGGSSSTSAFYYAPISSTGVGTWTATSSYLASGIYLGSCDSSNSYIYCVGGSPSQTGVYYAPVSSTGIGTWNAGTSYPLNVYYTSCRIWSNYLYCFAGHGGGSTGISNVYYASISNTGVGAWTATTSYPLASWATECSIYNGYAYCVGGGDTNVYYAPISSTGVGPWNSTASYPTVISKHYCVAV